MGDFNLEENEAKIIKHLLTNIASAVCHRLDAIDEHLESVCINSWYIENRIDSLWPCKSADTANHRATVTHDDSQTQIESVKQDSTDGLSFMDVLSSMNADHNVSIITLNTEDDFPSGSWLGDANNLVKKVRVPISPIDLANIHACCQTPVKMALTLLDHLFDRDTQAMSNLSGTGKHSKMQLDPLMIYGIQCHLEKWFNISTDDWQQIRLNIDSKCRSAYRRKVLGLPLSVKQFRFQVPHAGAISAQSHESAEAPDHVDARVNDDPKVVQVCSPTSLSGSQRLTCSLSYTDGVSGNPVYLNTR